MKTPTWGTIAAFCAADDWQLDRQSKHTFFGKTLPDGTSLETHVPHGKQGQAIGPGLFHFILRTQLKVSAAEFWDAVENERPAKRPGHPPAAPTKKPDARMIQQLETDLGLGPRQIAKLSRDEALRLLEKHWSQPKRRP